MLDYTAEHCGPNDLWTARRIAMPEVLDYTAEHCGATFWESYPGRAGVRASKLLFDEMEVNG